jgi:hypothetical protein
MGQGGPTRCRPVPQHISLRSTVRQEGLVSGQVRSITFFLTVAWSTQNRYLDGTEGLVRGQVLSLTYPSCPFVYFLTIRHI